MKFFAFASLALAAKIQKMNPERVTPAQMEVDLGAKSEASCTDTDTYYGWTDSYGDGCDWYYGNEASCGLYDDDDFWAFWDCCACGGGW